MSSKLSVPPNRAAIPLSVSVLVALLAFIEFASGFLQGFYLPLFGVISVHLGVSDADITWFSVVSTLAMGVLVPVLSKLGDIYGHRRMLRIATVAVLAGALLVALAPSYPLVLVGRVLCGPLAVWLPLEIALVHNRISGEGARKAIGTLVGFLTIGAIVGTLTAGTVATFVANMTTVLLIPVALVALCVIVVFAFVPESDVRAAAKIDVIGFVGLGLAMMGLLWGLRQAQVAGFASAGTILPLAAAALILVAWGWWELKVEVPAINLRMVATRRLWPAYVTSFLFGMVMLGGQTIGTTFMSARPDQVGYGFALTPGLLGILAALATALSTASAIGFPYVARRIGMRGVLLVGASLGAASNLILIPFHSQLWHVAISLALSGLAAGLLLGALPAIVAENSPDDQTGIATGLYNSLKTIGGSAAGALFGVVLGAFAISGTKSSSLGGYLTVWGICAAAFVGCLLALSQMRTAKLSSDEDVAGESSEPFSEQPSALEKIRPGRP